MTACRASTRGWVQLPALNRSSRNSTMANTKRPSAQFAIKYAFALLLAGSSFTAMAWWNTGVVEVVNNSQSMIDVVFLEHDNSLYSKRPQTSIRPGAKLSFNGRVVPWCDNAYELQSKSITVRKVAADGSMSMLFRVCQNYRDDTVYFVPGDVAAWENRSKCATRPLSYLTIIVQPNTVPICKG
jgi:hypothetical protein